MLFKEIKLIEPIQKALEKNNYVTATPIQAKSIPEILKGKDLIGIAQTGTGKTAAFSLPILQNMYNQNNKVTFTDSKTLILAPTRELAAQIGENIKEYGKFTNFKHTVIFGGVKQEPQVKALNKGVDIIIATPGRLVDLINQKLVELSQIEYLILDEADKMLDMGFINDIKKILNKLPKNKQTLFFSATMPDSIVELTDKFLNNPVKIQVKPQSTTVEKIDQSLFYVDTPDKPKLLLELLSQSDMENTIVFTRTKHRSNKIARFLSQNGIPAESINGDKSQSAREKTMSNFKTGKIKVLLATEIVARGIDIDNISHVINYEIPNEPESYVHRIGRTARAEKSGTAYSLCSADEKNYILDIQKIIKTKIPVSKHNFHSDFAQNAKGSDAKPPKKAQFHQKNNGYQKSQESKSPTKNKNPKKENSSKSHFSKNTEIKSKNKNKNKNKTNNSDKSKKTSFNKNKSNSKQSNFKKKNYSKKPNYNKNN